VARVWRSQRDQTGQRRRQPILATRLAVALEWLCPHRSRWLRVRRPHVRRQCNVVFAVHARRTRRIPVSTDEVFLPVQVLLQRHINVSTESRI